MKIRNCTWLLWLGLATAPLLAQDSASAGKKSLSVADYARWRSIGGSTLSDDGAWVAWSYTQLRQDDELHVKQVDGARSYAVERGSRPVFSADGRWVAYAVSPTVKEIDRLEKDKKPVVRKAELMNLETGEKVAWDDVASFEFNKASTHLLVRKNRPEPKPKHEGSDLILRDLRNGRDELIGSASAQAFNRPGTLLAFTVDAADQDGNGIYLMDLAAGTRRALDNAQAKYTRMTWSEDGTALAVLRGNDVDTLAERANTLLAYSALRTSAAGVRHEIAPGSPLLPAGHVISDKTALAWTEPAARLLLGVRPQAVKPKKKEEDEWLKVSDVDVFHWADDRLQSVQRRTAEQDRTRADRAVYEVAANKLVVVADTTLTGVQFTRDGRWAIGSDGRAYVSDWKEARADYYRIDTRTGERTRLLEGHYRTLGLSPDSKWFLYWKDGHAWSVELTSGKHTNVTAAAPVSFVNAEWDYLGEKPAYGVEGWSRDGRQVLLAHRYDVWAVPLAGGTPRNLTQGQGTANEMRLRYVRTDPEERSIDLSRPLLFSAYGEWTKQAGFFELRGDRLRQLVYTDNIYGTPRKAAAADRVLFTRESWTEYPDLQVASLAFSDAKRLTDANPQQAEYRWGRRILFDYTNKDGVRLQGTLVIPDDHQPGQRLPMLVNFYEKYSQNLHRHTPPRYSSGPQFADYASNGYLVMQPDVHFRGGSSHSDMLECVEAAVRKVIEMGYADPARIGLHGHSYSGGGASYIATRSKLFAAIVAGAAPINLVGEFNILFRGTGQNNHQYDIHGQGRYGGNPYDDFDRYWGQSPISGVQTMDTPLLYMHGDNDQIVEYNQGMEFYNALRFLGKPVIFLSYPGEGHGLTKLENNLDYLTRMRQFYGHYLKGEPKSRWMEFGERFIDKENREKIPVNVEKPVAPKPVTAAGGGGQ